MKLQEIIDKFKLERLPQIPDEIKGVMKSSTEGLIASGIEKNIPKIGAKVPDFCLKQLVPLL